MATTEYDVRGADFLAEECAGLADSLRRVTVEVSGFGSGGGSGVIWHPAGLIITNAHVAPSTRGVVELWDGQTFDALVIRRSFERDLAAVWIEAPNLTAAPVRDSTTVRVGELAFAVGAPLGMPGTLTAGIIHSVGRVHPRARREWVQADVTLLPGNSGGPLADARGYVVGINSMIAGPLALAVPSSDVLRFLSGLIVEPVTPPKNEAA